MKGERPSRKICRFFVVIFATLRYNNRIGVLKGAEKMLSLNKVLIAEEGYEGKYVALESLAERTVIASGDNPEYVMEQARKKGVLNPIIFFVPNRGITQVY